MDFWDLTRVMVRRWYFAVPTLVLSVIAVFLVGSTVQPDYGATGFVLMIPPHRAAATPGAAPEPVRPHNPWADLGPYALGNAAVVKVNEGKVRAELVKSGFSDNATVTINEGSAMIAIEVVATGPAQATATVQEIVRRIKVIVAAEQTGFGVYPEDQYTTHPIADGSDTVIESGKVKRVLIVAGGVGLLLTAAMTIGLDAVLRRRQRRSGDGQPGMSPEMPMTGPPADRSPTSVGASVGRQVSRWPEPVGQRTASTRRDKERAPVEYQVPASEPAEPSVPKAERTRPDGVGAPDETIVLPLSFQRGTGQDKRNGR